MISELNTIKKGNVYYSDIPASFSKSLISNDLTACFDTSAIQQSLVGIITTKKGERPFDPDFGCNVLNQLFENFGNTTSYAIRADIKLSVEQYEPRVRLKNVIVTPNYDDNHYSIMIEYHLVTDYSTLFTTQFNLRSSTDG